MYPQQSQARLQQPDLEGAQHGARAAKPRRIRSVEHRIIIVERGQDQARRRTADLLRSRGAEL